MPSVGVGSRLPVLAEGNTRSTKSALGESAADERCGRCGAGALGPSLSSQRAGRVRIPACGLRSEGCGSSRYRSTPHSADSLKTRGSDGGLHHPVTVAYAGRDLRLYCDILLRAIVCAGQGSETGKVSQRGRVGFGSGGFRGMASTLAARAGVGIGREEGGYAWNGGERRWWTVRARAVGRWLGPELGAPRCTMCQGVARANRAPGCGMWRRSRVAVARSRVGAVARREEPNGGYP